MRCCGRFRRGDGGARIERLEGRLGRPSRGGSRCRSPACLARPGRRRERGRPGLRGRAGSGIGHPDHRPLRRRPVGRGDRGCRRRTALQGRGRGGLRGRGRGEEHRPLAFLARRERRRRLEEDPERVLERPDGPAKDLVRGEHAWSGRCLVLDSALRPGIRGALDEPLLGGRATLGPLMGRPDDRGEQRVNAEGEQCRQALP
jgi:hypothetical protein